MNQTTPTNLMTVTNEVCTGSFYQSLYYLEGPRTAASDIFRATTISYSKIDLLISSFLPTLAGTPHVFNSEHKDVRWWSFYDHSCKWDLRWHSEALVHQYAWWRDGINPWSLHSSDADPSEQIFSLRTAAWNVISSVTGDLRNFKMNQTTPSVPSSIGIHQHLCLAYQSSVDHKSNSCQ